MEEWCKQSEFSFRECIGYTEHIGCVLFLVKFQILCYY